MTHTTVVGVILVIGIIIPHVLGKVKIACPNAPGLYYLRVKFVVTLVILVLKLEIKDNRILTRLICLGNAGRVKLYFLENFIPAVFCPFSVKRVADAILDAFLLGNSGVYTVVATVFTTLAAVLAPIDKAIYLHRSNYPGVAVL